MTNYRSLSHTKWECKYPVVFIPKYRKERIYGGIRRELGDALRHLAEQKESRGKPNETSPVSRLGFVLNVKPLPCFSDAHALRTRRV